MIHFDISRTRRQRHHSGLTRVTTRLLEEFGGAVRPVELLVPGAGPARTAASFSAEPTDWWLTAELFCEEECPGLWSFLRERKCRLAAVYHDAIPLKRPHTTWPQSVARHAEYMRMLAEFDRVFAVSEASRLELQEFWAWQGVEPRATVEVVQLGADFSGEPRGSRVAATGGASVLCVGILEPRKNQTFLLDVSERLWRSGLAFELHLVGRVNPLFGRPILGRIRELQRTWRCLHYHGEADDALLRRLYGEACISVFPTLAEGCGLPLLESLWQGVPCVCSDLPVLRENADGGGCLAVTPGDAEAWSRALRSVLAEGGGYPALAAAAAGRRLPTWAEAAERILSRLAS